MVTDIDNHWKALESLLLDWANWMKPHFEADRSISEIIPIFQAYVLEQLLAAGVDKEIAAKYEAANPSWMSVAGLMRYWKKKSE